MYLVLTYLNLLGLDSYFNVILLCTSYMCLFT